MLVMPNQVIGWVLCTFESTFLDCSHHHCGPVGWSLALTCTFQLLKTKITQKILTLNFLYYRSKGSHAQARKRRVAQHLSLYFGPKTYQSLLISIIWRKTKELRILLESKRVSLHGYSSQLAALLSAIHPRSPTDLRSPVDHMMFMVQFKLQENIQC